MGYMNLQNINLGDGQDLCLSAAAFLHKIYSRMKQNNRIVSIASGVLIVFSALSLLMVSLMAFFSPQMVMDLVQVKLPNNDAYSSIRGVYGGVGLTIVISLVYLLVKDKKAGLGFLTMLWGFYALSRIITLLHEGPLGAFGSKWLSIESVLFICSVLLLAIYRRPLKHA